MDKKEKEPDFSEYTNEIKDLVTKVGDIIEAIPSFKDRNFGLFYQHGRLGYVDLDAFASSTKAKLNVDGEEKTLAEIKKDVDKE